MIEMTEGEILNSKICRNCHISLPRREFSRNSKNPDGKQNVCKGCRRKNNKLQLIYVHLNKEEKAELIKAAKNKNKCVSEYIWYLHKRYINEK